MALNFGWEVHHDVKVKDTDSSGDGNGLSSAVEKLQHRDYLADITTEELNRFCAGLSSKPWHKWAETNHPNQFVDGSFTYWSDCVK